MLGVSFYCFKRNTRVSRECMEQSLLKQTPNPNHLHLANEKTNEKITYTEGRRLALHLNITTACLLYSMPNSVCQIVHCNN